MSSGPVRSPLVRSHGSTNSNNAVQGVTINTPVNTPAAVTTARTSFAVDTRARGTDRASAEAARGRLMMDPGAGQLAARMHAQVTRRDVPAAGENNTSATGTTTPSPLDAVAQKTYPPTREGRLERKIDVMTAMRDQASLDLSTAQGRVTIAEQNLASTEKAMADYKTALYNWDNDPQGRVRTGPGGEVTALPMPQEPDWSTLKTPDHWRQELATARQDVEQFGAQVTRYNETLAGLEALRTPPAP